MRKNINLAHIKLISLFIVALCKAKIVCFSLLSTVFDSPAKSSSCLRRIQRYIRLFRTESIDCLLADREFVGEQWV